MKPPPAPSGPLTTLKRTEVVSVVDAGFGNFLGQVEVEPSLDQGRFRGWTIVDLSPQSFWERVDLKPGDVVTSVNGLPIEREMDAWAAFESLKTASELDVSYYRAGAERKLAYRIVD
ncbi:MAG TPA: PDZ domain-containing protein [Polyangiaceae bacterium]|nr:PDZ domain-containing protein [Polyangiaceae bacterium]